MKKIIFILSSFISLYSSAQEKIPEFSSQAGITFNTTAAYRISGTDTSLQNALVLAPYFRLLHKSGLGLNYSFNTLASGTGKKLFLHTLSASYQEYEKPVNVNLSVSHFFFNNNPAVPYSPITNELYGYVAYKKPWLAPAAALSLGFGQDENNKATSTLNTALGVTHDFSFSNKTVETDITPSIFINGGKNEVYSFLKTNKYIRQNTGSNGYLNRRGRGRRNGNSGNGNPTPTPITTQTVTNKFTFNNVELNLYSSFTLGHVEIVPDVSIFAPLNTDNAFSSYLQLKLGYNFSNIKLHKYKN